MRAFIAITTPPTIELTRLLARLACLGRAITPIDPANLHLTLRFLGEIAAGDMNGLTNAISHAVTGVQPFNLKFCGLGMFPNDHRPRILWTAATPPQPLTTIAHRLANLGTDPAASDHDRPWQAHITLARIKAKPPAEWAKLIHTHASQTFGRIPVDTIKLIASELTPHGPHYTTLQTISLA